MTRLTKQTLKTYASGMGLSYAEVRKWYEAAPQTARGRFLVEARAIERAWQQELAARAVPGFWARMVARFKARLSAWRALPVALVLVFSSCGGEPLAVCERPEGASTKTLVRPCGNGTALCQFGADRDARIDQVAGCAIDGVYCVEACP